MEHEAEVFELEQQIDQLDKDSDAYWQAKWGPGAEEIDGWE